MGSLLITPFDPWKGNLCTCPKKYSLSPYTGCSHGCLYCYASSYIKNFSFPREKKDFLKKLEKEIKKIPAGSLITIANSSDCYQVLEKKLKLTRAALKTLVDYDIKINLVTKSSLIIRDLDILKEFKNILVSISLTSLDEKLVKKLEPHTSSPKNRLLAIEKLSSYISIAVRLDPLIYPLNTNYKEIKRLIKQLKKLGIKQIITSTYKTKPDNYKKMLKSFPDYRNIWEKLYGKKGERKSGYTYLPLDLRKELIRCLRELTIQESLEFSSCREGFARLNTSNCDGSGCFV